MGRKRTAATVSTNEARPWDIDSDIPGSSLITSNKDGSRSFLTTRVELTGFTGALSEIPVGAAQLHVNGTDWRARLHCGCVVEAAVGRWPTPSKVREVSRCSTHAKVTRGNAIADAASEATVPDMAALVEAAVAKALADLLNK